MRISLKSNLDLGFFEMELPEDGVTLRDVLLEVCRRNRGLDVIDSRNEAEVDDGFVVSVNGREYMFLPKRLDSPLSDGDQVEVAVAVFGGG